MRLRLAYQGAAAGAPRTLILKTGLPERLGGVSGRQEVAFYTQVAAMMPERLVPRCFDGDWDAATGAWHLLLEDLSESHFVATVWPLPPTVAQCERIVGARAQFHAAWWGDPRLGSAVGEWLDTPSYVQNLADVVTRFSDRYGESLSGERRALFESLLAAAPHLRALHDPQRHLTIVHEDGHVWNCFLPCDGGGDVRFFDWDAWRINIGALDLVFCCTQSFAMCALSGQNPPTTSLSKSIAAELL